MAPTLGNRLKGVSFAMLMLLSSFFGSLIFGGCLVPVLFVRPAAYRHLYDYMIGLWLWLAAALLETLIGINVAVFGDQIRSGEPSIIIMNHRTRLDWLFFWCALARQPSGIMSERIILKSSLKHLPGPGWGMQAGCCLFVKRRWEEDKQYLETMLDYFRLVGFFPQILIFPEGTDYNESTKAKSDLFATTHNLQSYNHVLQPRITGFAFLTSYARQNWPNAAIYDVTIAYPGSFPQAESEFVNGNFPESVRFHIKRYSVESDIPESASDLEPWLRSRWGEKDEKLANFFEKGGQFAGEPAQSALGLAEWINIYYRLTIAFWVVFVSLMLLLAFSCVFVRWLLLGLIAFYVFVDFAWGGFEYYQARYTITLLGQKSKP